MGSQILGWADVVMDTAEVVALGAVLWSLLRVDRKIAAVLRVIRQRPQACRAATVGQRRWPSQTCQGSTPLSKLESTVRYLGIEVDDALSISEQVEL